MTQISCSNCGEQKGKKLRDCPHCKASFFPCRKCKTLLDIKKYRLVETLENEVWEDEVVGTYERWDYGQERRVLEFVTRRVKNTVTKYRIKELPCSICNTKKPFKRFGNTLVGGLILGVLGWILLILSYLLPIVFLIFVLSITYVSKVVATIPYWWVIYMVLILLIFSYAPRFTLFLFKAIFGDMLGIPLDRLYHWER